MSLLGPLAGGEELAEAENEALPIDLQYLDPGKEREPDAHLREVALQSLYQVPPTSSFPHPSLHYPPLQLCSTRMGRKACRTRGAYYILREYERWESVDTREES